MHSVKQKSDTMITLLSDLFVKVDNIFDRTPLSPITNIGDIAFKCLAIVFTKIRPSLNNNHYVTHLKNKSFKRCFALMVPVLGFIAVALYDRQSSYVFSEEEQKVLNAIIQEHKTNPKTNYADLTLEKDYLKKNSLLMLAAMKATSNLMIMHVLVHENLKKNAEFMLEAIAISPHYILFADASLKNDYAFIEKVLEKFEQITNQEAKRAAYDSLFDPSKGSSSANFATPEILKNAEEMAKIIEKFPECIHYVFEEVLNTFDFQMKMHTLASKHPVIKAFMDQQNGNSVKENFLS